MKIAVIEDDVFFQKFYSTRLTEQGFETLVASDGDEGLAMISSCLRKMASKYLRK